MIANGCIYRFLENNHCISRLGTLRIYVLQKVTFGGYFCGCWFSSIKTSDAVIILIVIVSTVLKRVSLPFGSCNKETFALRCNVGYYL